MSSRAARLAPLVLLLLGAAFAGDASAHAQYVSSSPAANAILPAPPASVTITLSEPIAAGTASIRVTNATGARVEDGTARTSTSDATIMFVTLKPLAPDVYTVAWSATSGADGHFTAGSFYFAVEYPNGDLPCCLPSAASSSGGAPISPVEIALRFGTFLGLSIAFGAALLAAVAWVPTAAGEEPERATAGLRALFLWGRSGALIFAVTVAGLWGLQWSSASGLGALNVPGSPFIASLVARLVIGLVLVATFDVLASRADRAEPLRARSPALWAPVALGLAAIAAESIGTHAAASSAWAPLSTLADAAHLAGVAAWVGGLLVLVRLRAWFFREDAVAFSRQAVGLFSRLALYSVGLVLVAGIALSIFLVGSVDALLGTAYGWVVLAKVSLFVPMLVLGAFNRYRHLPTAGDPESGPAAVRALARNVRWESTLGAVVLALAAILTALAPPVVSGTAGGPFLVRSTVDGVRFDFQVVPAPTVPGNYTFVLELWNATNGAPYASVRAGYLNFTRLTTSVNQTVPLDGPHGNHFFVASEALNAPGTWRIVAVITRNDGSRIRATFYLQVSAGGG